MPFTALLFSGGLDSVAMGILLAREGHEVEPCYLSHRHGGNVTKKEAVTAADLAMEVCGRALVVVKPLTAREGWWAALAGQILHTKKLPIPKEKKDRRNRIFIQALRDVGIMEDADHVALGILGVEGETEFLPPAEAQALLDRMSAARKRDVEHEDLERQAGLAPGQLITPLAMGLKGKVDLLREVDAGGRGKQRRREVCWSSESCLMYFNTHCGACSSCKGRVRAFMAAWGEDRTPYREDTFAWRHKRGL